MTMRSTTLVLGCALVTLICVTDFAAAPRDLTLADRIEAQGRIERVRHAHQIGEKRPFEAVFPQSLLERKVKTYLRQSLALERIWKTPVTAAMVRAEAERMQRGTRMPERLAELHRALDNDPVLILECLVRPVLVERLARERFASDPAIHADTSREAELLHAALSGGTLDPRENHPARQLVEVVLADRSNNATRDHLQLPREQYENLRGRAPAGKGVIGPVQDEGDRFVMRIVLEEHPGSFLLGTFSVEKRTWDDWWASIEKRLDPLEAVTVSSSHDSLPVETVTLASCSPEGWDNGALDDLSEPPSNGSHTAVWTGSVVIVWGEDVSYSIASTGGARYDPATDFWSPISQVNAPTARRGHVAVWADSEMLVWGGIVFNGSNYDPVSNGGRYDPVSDTWSTMAVAGAPVPPLRTGVWTGTLMLVWGNDNGEGGRYDPSTDTWSPISMVQAPGPRDGYTSIWTGSRMIIWGGWRYPSELNDGGQYDPITNRWSSIASNGAPSPRTRHTAVWTGTLMVVAGGHPFTLDNEYGGRYDPARNRWESTAFLGWRKDHTAVWTGSRMIVWGGSTYGGVYGGGYAYDPVNDQVSAISSAGEPDSGPIDHVAVWTGDIMFIQGGSGASNHTYGRYHAASDTWLPTASSLEPRGRSGHSAVWSGNLMLIWGGSVDGTGPNTGFAYEPATDSFSPLATLNAPAGRSGHTAVWSGSQMLIWGGGVAAGGRYDPLAGSWSTMTTSGQPSARSGNSAVWTGSEMVVWGGYTPVVCGPGACYTIYSDGGRYNPASDTWTYIPFDSAAPEGRAFHTAVWTGSKMVIWGGERCTSSCYGTPPIVLLSTGGVLDLTNGVWSSTLAPLAPRIGHSAVWTGYQMIIWGGGSPGQWGGGPSGIFYQDGARYDPYNNIWSSIGLISAPSARRDHSIVWTGTDMIVWGGGGASGYLQDGARYRPLSDTWVALPLTGAPAARKLTPAVWTGKAMMFWGGESPGGVLRSGGRYFPDSDADGFTTCDDCDDASAAVYPGASQACDGINNDCSDPVWPAVPSSEQDADGDGFRRCAGAQPADCDDAAPGSWSPPGAARDLVPVDAAGDMLTWEAPLDGGATNVSHDVLRAASGVSFGPTATCIESIDMIDRIAFDTTTPLPGGIYFYLVRVENGCPAGLNQNMGTDSGGTPRSGRACP